ncbi:MAG: DedA family protein [Alphaproteobacteria bacterium]|nr:DedA family protein [Alphaproteobacteria bacterium]
MKWLYDKTMHLMAGKKAISALCALSFAESSFFPIPPDILMIPLILKQREKAFHIAFLCTLFSVLGGAFGYIIGMFLYDTVAVPVLNYFDAMDSFERIKQMYLQYGGWIVLGAGITPLPYKLITIASGVMGMNFLSFMLVSFIGRGIRFFLVAALLWKWGKPMKNYIEQNLAWLSILFFILLIGAFFLIKLF